MIFSNNVQMTFFISPGWLSRVIHLGQWEEHETFSTVDFLSNHLGMTPKCSFFTGSKQLGELLTNLVKSPKTLDMLGAQGGWKCYLGQFGPFHTILWALVSPFGPQSFKDIFGPFLKFSGHLWVPLDLCLGTFPGHFSSSPSTCESFWASIHHPNFTVLPRLCDYI